MNRALIFIPGIKGTKLYDSNTLNNEVLWQDIRFNFEDFSRIELSFKSDQHYYDEAFSALVKPLQLEPLAYQEFWKHLHPDYPYKFLFPYDWRLPNAENGKRLAEFIELLIEKSRASKQTETITSFDIVTHSMGNMPLRYYLLNNGMKHLNKIIFVAPPFLGSIDAVSALTMGQGFFFNQDHIRKMARSLPALFELLPDYDFAAIDSKSATAVDLWNPDNWQKNLVTLTGKKSKDERIKKFLANLANAKEQKDILANWMSPLKPKEKDRILILVKTELKTLCDVVVEEQPDDENPENYFDFKESLHADAGDGVVPDASSCCYFNKLATYTFENQPLHQNFKHPFILKDNRIQKTINTFLNSSVDAQSFKPNIFGRTIKRVKKLETREVKQNGITHKIQYAI